VRGIAVRRASRVEARHLGRSPYANLLGEGRRILLARETLHGHVDEETKHDLLASSWVLAVPSLKEGWGLVVVEAAAHATPTVGFRAAGGLRESVHDGVGGLLVDDYAGFVASLEQVLTDPGLRDRLEVGARAHAYTFSWDGSVQAFEQGLGVANTFAWSPDDKTMYFADTLDAIYAYDFDAAPGRVANRRTFGKLDTTQYGHPDGSTIDAEGFLWNARWDGGCLVRWAPDGKVDRVVQMPCRRVTSCIFGGPDLNTLYITTVRYGLSASDLAEQPLAGGIFALELIPAKIVNGAAEDPRRTDQGQKGPESS
jgi:hypothetical protein